VSYISSLFLRKIGSGECARNDKEMEKVSVLIACKRDAYFQ
jgi:hypothetical protein